MSETPKILADVSLRRRIAEQLKPQEWIRVTFEVEGDPQGKARARAVPGADPLRGLALTHLEAALRMIRCGQTSRADQFVRQALACLAKSHPTARMRKPERTRAYEKRIGQAFDAAVLQTHRNLYHEWKPHTGPVVLSFAATFRIPPSWPKWQQEAARYGAWRMSSPPDKDNIEKAICDGLDGIAFRRDAQVCQGAQHKGYGDRPGIRVELLFLHQLTFADWKRLRNGLQDRQGGGTMGPSEGGPPHHG